jgi:hypothetical protein
VIIKVKYLLTQNAKIHHLLNHVGRKTEIPFFNFIELAQPKFDIEQVEFILETQNSYYVNI